MGRLFQAIGQFGIPIECCTNILSHSCLLLSATKAEPSQTPLPSVPTQLPLREYFPAPQIMQSLELGPEQVLHRGEQGWQDVPSLKLPSGQTVPVEVVAWAAKHCVRSFASCVKPVLQVIQSPLPSAHWVQPKPQTGIDD